jgi:hypothetical protein
MISLFSLWLPILLSAMGVFVVSSFIHMALSYHQSDWKKLPAEEEIADSLRKHALPPGNYIIPHGEGMKAMSDPEFLARMERGPVAFLMVDANGPPNMAKPLTLWFLFSLLVSFFAAYLASRALEPGTDYMAVFRFTGTVAFGAYALGELQASIWGRRSWSTTFKNMIDGFVYAVVTAGFFGWLWPAG